MGRGDVLTVLPDIKTLNKVVELTLKNAAIAVTGIWQAEDDGVTLQHYYVKPGIESVFTNSNITLQPAEYLPKSAGDGSFVRTPRNARSRRHRASRPSDPDNTGCCAR